MLEIHLLELAELEMNGFALWQYYKRRPIAPTQEEVFAPPSLGGDEYYAKYSEETGYYHPVAHSKTSKIKNVNYPAQLMKFLGNLQAALHKFAPILPIHTNHKRYGMTFRANPNMHGEPWRDWVLIDFGSDGKLPCHIMGFIDLSILPGKIRINVDTVRSVCPGLHAIIECGNYYKPKNAFQESEIFRPIEKEMTYDEETETLLHKYFLVDVEQIESPIAVVPDIGGESNHYFQVNERESWRSDFETWLNAPYDDDKEWLDTESVEDVEQRGS